MAETLKSVFDRECGSLVVDEAFAQKIRDFAIAFINKNADHVRFFGGSLIGVNPVRWVDYEYSHWFQDILDADDIELAKGIKRVPGIDPNWKRATDVVNMSMVYVMYRLEISSLSKEKRLDAQLATMELMHYKFISSLMFHYFPHPADRAVAQTAYSILTKKYDLKLYGSWGRFFKERALDIVSASSIHRTAYEKFDDTKAIVYMINDVQGRLRSVVKNVTAVFYQVKETNQVISSTSSIGVSADGAYLKDKKSTFVKYKHYLTTIVSDKNSFIRGELTKVIASKVTTARDWLTIDALKFLSDNYGNPKYDYLEKLCDETLLHAFDVLISKRIKINDLPGIIDRLKVIYTASRTSDPAVLIMRELGDRLVTEVLPVGRAKVVAPERASVLLYIVLRTLSMQHYQNGGSPSKL